MEVVQTTGELAELLAEFDQRGGVVEYVVMSCCEQRKSAYAMHKDAAVLTLKTLSHASCNDHAIHAGLAEGKAITANEFVGPFYDPRMQRLVIPTSKTSAGGLSDFITQGYADAFSDPPYGLSGSLDEINKMYLRLNMLLFGDFLAGCEIYAWSTNWSDYFDTGREWWGAFLWTVHDEEQSRIVGVAASSTD